MWHCIATIGSPWRMGMRVTCELKPGHAGPHWGHSAGNTVMWTGGNERFTKQAAKRAGVPLDQLDKAVRSVLADRHPILRPSPGVGLGAALDGLGGDE